MSKTGSVVAVQVWKPLLIVLPGGLILGMIGGHYAHPVVQHRSDDRPSLPGIKTPTDDGDAPTAMSTAPSDPVYDDGGAGPAQTFSDDRAIASVPDADLDDDPAYRPAPLPTIDELKAEAAARDAPSRRRATRESAIEAAGKAADDAEAAAIDGPGGADDPQFPIDPQARSRSPASHEPRTPDGKLPAIW